MKMLVKILLLSSVSLLAASSSSEDSADVSSSGPRVGIVRDFSCIKEMLQKRIDGKFFPLTFISSIDPKNGNTVIIEDRKIPVRSRSGGNEFFPGTLKECKVASDGRHTLLIHVPIETRDGLVYNKRTVSYNAEGQIVSDRLENPNSQVFEPLVE